MTIFAAKILFLFDKLTMRNRFFTTSLLTFSLLTAMAIPAKRGTNKFIKLTDGSTVRVTLVGDEFMHCWQDSLGNKYFPAEENGLFRLASQDALAKLSSRSNGKRAKANTKRTSRLTAGKASEVFTGKKKGLVILAEYTDVKFKSENPQQLFDDISNKENYSEGKFQGSVKDYFLAQSRGKFELDFDVVGPVTLSNNMAYYGANDAYGQDVRPELMVVEGCKAIDSEVNFADYDWDGDGEVDQVYVVYAGYGEADTYNKDNTVWPHEWALSGSSITGPLTLDGVKVDTYACSSELNGDGSTSGIGTMCHEFSHCMGLPDMYDVNYDGNFGMGPWDLMDYGSYNADGYLPAGYTSYERMVSGWLAPIEVSRGDNLTVTGMEALAENGEAYKLVNSGNADEYYLVENRQQLGWDAALPASGVLVLHVDYDENLWACNYVNSTGQDIYSGAKNNHQRLTILHADNDDDSKYFSPYTQSYSKVTYTGDPYPYVGNDSITAYSVPASATYTANTDGKKFMDVAIRNISIAADGTASMEFGQNYYAIKPNQPSGDLLFCETFDQCAGTGGNDGVFGGSASVANKGFIADNEGWIAEKAFGADKCAKFGNSKVQGTVTSPAINVDGEATLTFRAVPWGTDGKSLTLSVTGGAIISPSTFTMSEGEWTDFTATITGAGPIKVKFAPAKRFFLDDVYVATVATSVDGIDMSTVVPVAVYSVSGTPRQGLCPGVNIVRYSNGTVRKVIQRNNQKR